MGCTELGFCQTDSPVVAGIMHTPALAIDDEIVIEGKVSSPDEIKGLLS